MKKNISIILILSLLLNACSSFSYIKEDENLHTFYKRINQECSGQVVRLTLKNRKDIKAADISVQQEYTFFVHTESSISDSVLTAEISMIKRKTGDAAQEELIVGSLGGVFLGVGIGHACGLGKNTESRSLLVLAGIVSGLVGSFLGSITGTNSEKVVCYTLQ